MKRNASWCLICVLALSGCKTVGPAVCPTLPEPPPSVMQPPETEKKVRRELFEPQQTQTPKSAPSKTLSEPTERDKAIKDFASDIAGLWCVIDPSKCDQ